jgi:hypothetical protein
VPLSYQAMGILKGLRTLTGGGEYVLPSQTHVEQHDKYGIAPAEIHEGSDDRARIPGNGKQHTPQ